MWLIPIGQMSIPFPRCVAMFMSASCDVLFLSTLKGTQSRADQHHLPGAPQMVGKGWLDSWDSCLLAWGSFHFHSVCGECDFLSSVSELIQLIPQWHSQKNWLLIWFTNYTITLVRPNSSIPTADTDALSAMQVMAEFSTGIQQHCFLMANGSGTNLQPMGYHQPQLKTAMKVAQCKIINLLKTLRAFCFVF